MPTAAVIAGPNGSGKTTFYRHSLRRQFPEFVNADEIAREMFGKLPSGPPADRMNRQAAVEAEARRAQLVSQRRSFAFETVFSRTDVWIRFLAELKQAGYEIHLFFICTDDPMLNVSRVERRFRSAEGHDVAPDKVVSRYPNSIQTAVRAIEMADRSFLYDNTGEHRRHRLIVSFTQGRVTLLNPPLPRWTDPFLRDRQSP